jgi:hypothetical protein
MIDSVGHELKHRNIARSEHEQSEQLEQCYETHDALGRVQENSETRAHAHARNELCALMSHLYINAAGVCK